MSTVSGPSSKPPADAKTQREELREMNEAHQAEVIRLQDENKKRIDQVHQEANAKLNDKDIQHQKEIDSIRAMHAKRMAEV